MKKLAFIFLLITTSVFGQSKILTSSLSKPKPGDLTFIVFGDWGRDGKYGQIEVSNLMEKTAAEVTPSFIISTGDNFYPDGVSTVNAKQWQTSFESIYSGTHLFCPWYVVLGNHDYHSNPEAEVEYTRSNKRWKMPARYYMKSFRFGNDSAITADFVFIDSTPLEDEYYQEKSKYHLEGRDTTRQLQWIDSVLSSSKAHWKIVVGHHPLYTGGKRAGEIQYLRKHLERIFEKYNVDAYLCGHEHDLQHLYSNKTTQYFISGAGSEIRKTGKIPETKFAIAENGIMVMSINAERINVDVVTTTKGVVYHTEVTHAKR